MANQNKKPSPIPEGRTHATPYLIIRGAASALEWYQRALGARVGMRMDQPDGKVGHAEFHIGKAELMCADEFPDRDIFGPQKFGGTGVTISLYVEDVDAMTERAKREGAKILRPPTDQFYGERNVQLEDPYGHRWSFASRIEDLSEEEIKTRAPGHEG